MTQDDAYVFATMAALFSPTRERWDEVTSERAWPDFVENVRDLLRGSRLPGQDSARLHAWDALFLSRSISPTTR